MAGSDEQTKEVEQPIRCRECGNTRRGTYVGMPETPIGTEICPDCEAETAHEAVEEAEVPTLAEEIVIFRCIECGEVRDNIGSLHAHCEKHRGIFGIQLPWKYGDAEELMDMTQAIRVREADIISPRRASHA